MRIGNARVTFDNSGRAYISRRCDETIAYLDEHMIRLPNQYVWEPKTCFEKWRSISELKPLFRKHCYIVGKGRSADNLKAHNFPTNDPIIGINEAVLFMEELGLPNQILGVRQDISFGIDIQPKDAIMIIRPHLIGEYHSYPNTYLFKMLEDFGVNRMLVTVFVAILVAKKLGVEVITMYGFDAFTVKDTNYGAMANIRNTSNNTDHLLLQKDQLQYVNKGVKLRWVLPDLENYLTVV